MLCLLHRIPASRKRASSRCVLHLFGIEYRPVSHETGSESPFTLSGTAGGYRFAKAGPYSKAPMAAGLLPWGLYPL